MKRGSPHLGQNKIPIPYFEFEKKRNKEKETSDVRHPP